MCVQLTRDKSGVLIRVRLKPRGRKNAITEIQGGVTQIEVSAPPVENAANAALLRVLAEALGCAKSELEIMRGEKSRDKTVRVLVLDEDGNYATCVNEFKEK